MPSPILSIEALASGEHDLRRVFLSRYCYEGDASVFSE